MGKLYQSLLVLCAVQHGANAFVVGVPKKQSFTALQARVPLYAGDYGYAGASSVGMHRLGAEPRAYETRPRGSSIDVGGPRVRGIDERMMEREEMDRRADFREVETLRDIDESRYRDYRRGMQGRVPWNSSQRQRYGPQQRYGERLYPERNWNDQVVIGENMEGQMTRSRGLQTERSRRGIEEPSQTGIIQGGSREIWSAPGKDRYDQMEVFIDSEGRPVNAEVELYQGPNNVRQRVRFYSEDGWKNPFHALVDTPRGVTHSVSVRNTGSMAFPISSSVQGRHSDDEGMIRDMTMAPSETVQGGSLKTYPFYGNDVQSVQVSLKTDGMPLMAVVELWQGPNNVKQIAEVYSDDGNTKPFNLVVDTAEYESTIAIYNTGPMTFPLQASVEPI